MPASMTFEDHVTALEAAGTKLVDRAAEAGMDAPVPTCPAWTARALVAHQAMVHRWAAANVRGDDPGAVPSQTEIRRTVADLPDFYRAGLGALVAALRAAPADLRAMTFLNDAPPPREFWARRQTHETTIHGVDSLAARLGRVPTADEAAIDRTLAVDGLDELLRGFFTRGRSKLYDGAEYTLAVMPDDADQRWIVHVAERLTVESGREAAVPGDVAATISGTAAQLYLALWNRGTEARVIGRADVLDRWAATQRVSWS